MNLFALAVIALFTLAAIADLSQGLVARGFFYLCSALINVAVLFMK